MNYVNGEYPVGFDLSLDFFSSAKMDVLDIIPSKNKFIIKTTAGDKLLKKLNYKKPEFEVKAYEKLITWKGEIYCITDLQWDRLCDYRNIEDVAMAVKALANFHEAGKTYGFGSIKSYNENLIYGLKNMKNNLDFFGKIAMDIEYKNGFDEIFLKNISNYLGKMEVSIANIEDKLVEDTQGATLCINNFSQYNIFIKDKEAFFTDFDKLKVDLRCCDLWDFINKALKHQNNDLELVNIILEEYENTSRLRSEEIQIIIGLLLFPIEFYELIKAYYTRRKNWSEATFINKLIKILEDDEKRQLELL